jgi:cell division protein FtsZ
MPSQWPTRCSIPVSPAITDLMTKEGLINLDFADVRSIMREMGKAMMGTGEASGEKRAIAAAEAAISNPLLDDVRCAAQSGLLISITGVT